MKRERENIDGTEKHQHPSVTSHTPWLGARSATSQCAPTGSQIHDLSDHRTMLQPTESQQPGPRSYIASAWRYRSLLMSSAQPTSIISMWLLSGTSIFSFILQFLSPMQNFKLTFPHWSYSLCSRQKQLPSCWCKLSTYYISGLIPLATCENYCEVDRAWN